MIDVFGIDPGNNGAIAWLVASVVGGCMIDVDAEVLRFKDATRQEIFEFIVERRTDKSSALIEKVGATPQMGVVSAFTFGRNYERPLMALSAAGVRCEKILPRAWQKFLGITFKKGMTHPQRKKVLRQLAQELYPDIKVTNAVADALLIARVAWLQKRSL